MKNKKQIELRINELKKEREEVLSTLHKEKHCDSTIMSLCRTINSLTERISEIGLILND